MPLFEKLDQEVVNQILKLREEGYSYRKIEEQLGVSRETARQYCIELLSEEAKENLARRKKKKSAKVNNISKTRKKPKPQYNSVRDYDFLQYVRVVFRWALSNNPTLNKGKLELLLYLYPKGAFSFTKFYEYHKTISIFQKKTLKELIEDGWIYLWRPRTKNTVPLYALTDKAKRLCDDMHKFCVGDKQIPEEPSKNNLFKSGGKRINNYFGDMIKDMNRRRDSR